ncbi:MAG: DUF4350 domain-containing protein [Archaeoglobaceae archaeon]
MRQEILIALAISFFVLLLLIYFVPSGEDLDLRNPYWNGMKNFSAVATKSLEIESSKALLIVANGDFSKEEVEKIRRFVEEGGLLVVANEFGDSNSLLDGLGLKARFNGSMICDRIFKYRSKELPIAFSNDLILILNKATFIEGEVKEIAKTSDFSFLCENELISGPFVVAGEVQYGKGKVLLISDSSIFTNSMLSLGNNSDFLEKIFDREVLVYAKRSALSDAKDFVEFLMSSPEFRYSYIVLLSLIFLRFGKRRKREGELEKVVRENPDWDKELLRRLENERANR